MYKRIAKVYIYKHQHKISEPLLVTINTKKARREFLIVLIIFIFCFIIIYNAGFKWQSIIVIGMLVVFIIHQYPILTKYISRPFIVFDSKGISHDGKTYDWLSIDSIEFLKDTSGRQSDLFYINLTIGQRISIHMPISYLSVNFEYIEEFLKKEKIIRL